MLQEIRNLASDRGYQNVAAEEFDAGHQVGLVATLGGLSHVVRAHKPVTPEEMVDALDAWFIKEGIK